MEKYDKVGKIGRGTFGDVLLVKRKEDSKVRKWNKAMTNLDVCNEESANWTRPKGKQRSQ